MTCYIRRVFHRPCIFLQDIFLPARKYLEEIYMDDEKLYVCSMSSKTIVYKGLMLPNAIKEFYFDLNQENFRASTCVFHHPCIFLQGIFLPELNQFQIHLD